MKRPWLVPLTPLYAAGLGLRNLRIEKGWEQVRRLRFPVVSIGNISTGGAGKTPLAIALAKALTRREFKVDVLSRGYGRRSGVAARVDSQGTAEEFGDEPLLIARETGLPVYVAGQRYEAGLLAEADSSPGDSAGGAARVHLLDDGFQHRQLHRDVDILLLNREDWTESLLPAGNLREPLKALRRAGVIAIPADDAGLEAELKAFGWQGQILRLRRTMEVPSVAGPVVAFCGIARPQQFFDGLESAGLRIGSRKAFPDHHLYSAGDLERLVASARKVGAGALVTTEKDLVRMGKLAERLAESVPVMTVGLRVEIMDEDAFVDWIGVRLDESRGV